MVFQQPPRQPRGFSNSYRMNPMQMHQFQPYHQQIQQPSGLQRIIGQFLNSNPSVPGTVGGGGGLSKTLDNVQQVLKVVETTAPMVKQYGPMVKNLPAMFNMLKALKDLESTDTESIENEKDLFESSDSINSLLLESSSNSFEQEKHGSKKTNTKDTLGQSTPKLYI